VRAAVECEFQLADQNWSDTYTLPTVMRDGRPLPCQVEKEQSNLSLDWRKRVVFLADLQPSRMNRFDCRLEVLPCKPEVTLKEDEGALRFATPELEVVINARTGLVDRLRANGVDCVKEGAFRPLVLADDEDPWGMRGRRYDRVAGEFALISPEEGTRFSGVSAGVLPSVRVIEDGAVRTVVEAVLAYGGSAICQRYKLPKQGTEIEVETRVHWDEKDRMLKLAIPTPWADAAYRGQVAYGTADLPANGDEAVAQKWVAAVGSEKALTVVNDGVYGSSFEGGEVRLTLLRSPAYSGHPIGDRPVVPQDRYTPRIDQGERLYRFWIDAGPAKERLAAIDREALAKNEKPFALSFFPAGAGERPKPGALLSDDAILLTALKWAEEGDAIVVRLYNPTPDARRTSLALPFVGVETDAALSPYEIKTLLVDPASRHVREADLLERPA